MTRRRSWRVDAVRGAIAGCLATWVMDLVTTGMYEAQAREVTEAEAAARPNGKSSVANLVDRAEAMLDVDVPSAHRDRLEQAVHYGLGVVPGAAYGVLRNRLPLVGAGRGLLFGLVLFAVNDEWLNTRLGLAGPISAYPPETHLRGLVGHAVLGATTDTALSVLGA